MKSETLFNRFWRRRGAIKVIIFIILIIPWLVACNEEGGPTDPGDEVPAEVFDDSVTDSEGDLTAPHDAKVTPPPLTATWFPAYRPGWLLRTLDNALCQMNGLPPQSAAILCETNALRRLEVPLDNPLENVQSLIDQIVERRRPAEQLERLAPGLGARMGTTLLVNYLRLGGRSLGEITSIAAELLGNLEDIEFPTELCPREGSKTKGLSAHPLCAAIGGSLPPSSAAP